MRRAGPIIALLLFAVTLLDAGVPLARDAFVPLSRIDRFDGSPLAPPASPALLRQAVHEFHLAADTPLPWPSADDLRSEGRRLARAGVYPIAILNATYETDGGPARAFAVTALGTHTYHGERVNFTLPRRHYLGDGTGLPSRVVIDFGDGTGYREVGFGETATVSYPTAGIKTVRTKVTGDGGVSLESSFRFDVRALAAPLPNDTLSVTATIPHLGQYGSGEAYLYLADGHTSVTNPIVVVEGFDLDDTLNWDELYAILNDEGLIEAIRAEGYDAVVLNFTEATAPIQENAFLLVELLSQVQAMILPQQRYSLIGASMGGLVSRYALCYMESNAITHQVGTFITFDTPHRGANIPLGIQYWLDFFSSNSTDAAFLLSRLDTPAARQMLVYHHRDPPESSPSPDPAFDAFQSELATLGGYPAQSRNVAVANGSALMQDQGFNAGDQVIDYNADIVLARVKGNVWAVPDGGSRQIFEGEYFVLFPPQNRLLDVTVTGTLPYDNAPGGSRSSMADMDSTEAPIGDIVALHNNHCFIPTTSALDMATSDLFYDIAGDPAPLAMTPFDAIYYPTSSPNQPHVDVTAENATWFLDEILGTPNAVRTESLPVARLEQNYPNPFNPSTTIVFEVRAPREVELAVFDARGQRVVTLVDGPVRSGAHTVRWDGRNASGAAVATGVYFCRLVGPGGSLTRKMVLLK